MAVTSGTVSNVSTIRSEALDPLQHALVLFTMSGTYAQSDNSILSSVHTAISGSRRNGKTVTLKNAACYQMARKDSNPALMMGLKTVAISTNDITFEITESATAGTVDLSTELANGTIPTQIVPFGLIVGFTEA